MNHLTFIDYGWSVLSAFSSKKKIRKLQINLPIRGEIFDFRKLQSEMYNNLLQKKVYKQSKNIV